MFPAAPTKPADQNWNAELTLTFSAAGNGRRTRLINNRHQGPLQVQRPFYPETNGTCHVYILHPPGGVVGGDSLRVETELGRDAQVLLTTPAAAKFYRSNGPMAYQTQYLSVQRGGILEWLPQETILYRGARVHTTTTVELATDAAFLGWEILCLGRPAAHESFDQGQCWQDLQIYRQGQPLYVERVFYQGGCELLDSPWGLNRFPVVASCICVTNQPHPLLTRLLNELRQQLTQESADGWFSVSQLDEILVCRYLGFFTHQARRLFQKAWWILRPGLLGKTACEPRVWHT